MCVRYACTDVSSLFPHQVAQDMEQQKNAVDVALQIRIDETRDAKSKLEGHLAKVCVCCACVCGCGR